MLQNPDIEVQRAASAALGNLAVQARAAGLLPAGLEPLRRTLRRGLTLRPYTPTTTRSGR